MDTTTTTPADASPESHGVSTKNKLNVPMSGSTVQTTPVLAAGGRSSTNSSSSSGTSHPGDIELEILLGYDSSPLHDPSGFPQLVESGALPPSSSIVLLDRNHQPNNFDKPPLPDTPDGVAAQKKKMIAIAGSVTARPVAAVPSGTPLVALPAPASTPMAALGMSGGHRSQSQPSMMNAAAFFQAQHMQTVYKQMAQQQQQQMKQQQEAIRAAEAQRSAAIAQQAAQYAQAAQAAAQARMAQAQAQMRSQIAAYEAAAAGRGQPILNPDGTPSPPPRDPTPQGPPPTHITVPLSSVARIQFGDYQTKMKEAAARIATDIFHIEVEQFAGFSVMSGTENFDHSTPIESDEEEIQMDPYLDSKRPVRDTKCTSSDSADGPTIRETLLKVLDEAYIEPLTPPPDPAEEWEDTSATGGNAILFNGDFSSMGAVTTGGNNVSHKRGRSDSESDGFSDDLRAAGYESNSPASDGADDDYNALDEEGDSDYNGKRSHRGRSSKRGRGSRGGSQFGAKPHRPNRGGATGPYAFAPAFGAAATAQFSSHQMGFPMGMFGLSSSLPYGSPTGMFPYTHGQPTTHRSAPKGRPRGRPRGRGRGAISSGSGRSQYRSNLADDSDNEVWQDDWHSSDEEGKGKRRKSRPATYYQ